MHADPVTDADQHYAYLANENVQVDRQEKMYRDIITETLTQSVLKVDPKSLSLPYFSSITNRICYKPLMDVVTDEVNYRKSLDLLSAVIGKSTCPIVAELRKAIAQAYADSHAEELAEQSL